MSSQADPGRRLILVVVATAATLSVLLSLGAFIRTGDFQPFSDLGRPAGILLLGYWLYLGHRWARWFLVGWLAVSTFAFMTMGLVWRSDLPLAIFGVALGLTYAALGLVLAISPTVGDFMLSRRPETPVDPRN